MNETIRGGIKTKFVWTKAIDGSFGRLNKEVETKPILVFPSFEKFYLLECDKTNIAFGGVLSQEGRPIAFFSERLNDAKSRYSTYNL